MKIERRIIDDLKTGRPDVTPSLPAYFQLVPLFFYVMIVGGILLSTFFLITLRNAAAAETYWKNESVQIKQSLADVQAQRESIEQQTRRANAVAAWIEGARNIQPLIIAIIRSIEEKSSIAEFALTRNPETPTQLRLKLKLNTQGVRQLDAILEKIASYNFKTYNPNHTQAKGEIDYEATLIYQDSAESQVPLPAPGKQP